MQGKQYHFSAQHSQPPNYWVLQEIDQKTLAILETWAFVGIEIYKCSTIYDLVQSRLVSIVEPREWVCFCVSWLHAVLIFLQIYSDSSQ